MVKHIKVDTWEVSPTEKNMFGYPMPVGETAHRLVAIRVIDDRLELRTLAGPDLPANLLYPLLLGALPEGWLAEAERRHQARVHPWLVTKRTGMSGCDDYSLRFLRDANFCDQPQAARLHVSMYGKLNEGVNVWIGDLPPLLAALIRDYPPPTAGFSFQVYEPILREYQDPGMGSGLEDVALAAAGA